MTAYSGCEGTDGGSNKHSMSSTHTLRRHKWRQDEDDDDSTFFSSDNEEYSDNYRKENQVPASFQ